MNVAAIVKDKGGRVVTVAPSDSVLAVCATLVRERIGAVLAIDPEGHMVGVLSERDIVRGLAEHGEALLAMTVDHLMTRQVIVCTLEDTIDSVMQQMTERRVRHIPVVENGRLAGLVSIGDVVKHRIREQEAEAEALRQYIASG